MSFRATVAVNQVEADREWEVCLSPTWQTPLLGSPGFLTIKSTHDENRIEVAQAKKGVQENARKKNIVSTTTDGESSLCLIGEPRSDSITGITSLSPCQTFIIHICSSLAGYLLIVTCLLSPDTCHDALILRMHEMSDFLSLFHGLRCPLFSKPTPFPRVRIDHI